MFGCFYEHLAYTVCNFSACEIIKYSESESESESEIVASENQNPKSEHTTVMYIISMLCDRALQIFYLLSIPAVFGCVNYVFDV